MKKINTIVSETKNKEDCCHPYTRIIPDDMPLEIFDTHYVAIHVIEVCEVCGEEVDDYIIKYYRRD